jgi:phosphoribosylanthranilate isomerase
MRVKICGLTRIQDAKLALELGATELGFIFAASPRMISIETAKEMRSELPKEAKVFGVFVNEKVEKIIEIVKLVSLQGVQLHGQESPQEIASLKQKCPDLLVMKAIGVNGNKLLLEPEKYWQCDSLIFDSAGSHFNPVQRSSFDFEINYSGNFYLAGGLTSKNILNKINKYQPFGIDLSSGVESSPGIKDSNLLNELFLKLKEAKCIPT